jgi:hypothetical protein
MSARQLRKELHEIIEIADDKWIEAIHAMLNTLMRNDNTIVGYSTSGKPLTQSELLKEIKASHEAGKQGEFFTTEQVLKTIEAW